MRMERMDRVSTSASGGVLGCQIVSRQNGTIESYYSSRFGFDQAVWASIWHMQLQLSSHREAIQQ